MCTRSAPPLDPPCHNPMPTGLLPLLQLGCWQILDDNNLYVQELPTRFSTARPSTVFCGLPFVVSLLWPVFCDQLSAFNVFLPGVWPLSLSSFGAKKNPHKKFLPQNLWLWSTPAMCRRNLREVVGILNLSRTKRLAALWCFGKVSMRCDCNAPIRSMCFFLLTPR